MKPLPATERPRRRVVPRPGAVRVFRAALYDLAERCRDRAPGKGRLPADGVQVRVIKAPHGCPPNGTMGHLYVEHLDGEFIGLVQLASVAP